MAKLGGPVGGALAFALTLGLAFDGGGYAPASFDRALVGVGAAALLLVVLAGGSRPGRLSAALLAGLGLLTAWTALSWLWSDSPPLALDEAPRVAVYLGAATVVVLAGRRVPVAWLAGGVLAGASIAVGWNLWLRLAPDWAGRSPLRSDIGQLADPIGYANSLALLAAIALVLALGFDGWAAALLVPLAAGIALQQSTGTVAALALGVVAYLLTAQRPLRSAALLVLPLAGGLVVGAAGSVVNPPPTNLLSAAHTGHRLLLMLVLLTLAQAAVASAALARSGRRPSPRLARLLALATGVVAVAAAPFAFGGHERGHYWRVAWHELAANPVLGSGAGTFAAGTRRTCMRHNTSSPHSSRNPRSVSSTNRARRSGLMGRWRFVSVRRRVGDQPQPWAEWKRSLARTIGAIRSRRDAARSRSQNSRRRPRRVRAV